MFEPFDNESVIFLLENAAQEANHVSVQSRNVLNIQMDILWQGWLMLMLLLLMMLLLLLLFGIRKGEILLHIFTKMMLISDRVDTFWKK